MFERYLNEIKLQGKRPQTLVEYRKRLTVFQDYLFISGLQAENITVRDMVNFRSYLLDVRGCCNRRANAVISTVRQMYSLAELAGDIDLNPCSLSLKLKSKRPRTERMSDENILRFMDYIDGLSVNARAAFYTLLATAARVGEVTKLMLDDFKIENGKLWINITDAKWESDRVVPFTNSRAQEIVIDYLNQLDNPHLPVFRLSSRTLQRYATNFAQETGITFHCHLLRHTVASKLLEDGTRIEMIQFLLGHRTVNMTSYYTQGAKLDLGSLAPTSFQTK